MSIEMAVMVILSISCACAAWHYNESTVVNVFASITGAALPWVVVYGLVFLGNLLGMAGLYILAGVALACALGVTAILDRRR